MKTGLEDKSEAELARLTKMAERSVTAFWVAARHDVSWSQWLDAAQGLRALISVEDYRRRVEASR